MTMINDSFLEENKQETLTIKTREREAMDEFGNDNYGFSQFLVAFFRAIRSLFPPSCNEM